MPQTNRWPFAWRVLGQPHADAVNGALWSLPYEITCYGALALASTVVTFALAGLSWYLVEKRALRWK